MEHEITQHVNSRLSRLRFTLQTEDMRNAVMEYAAAKDYGSDVVALALADVIGIMCAKLDVVNGSCSFKDRLHDFCKQVESRYKQQTRKPLIEAK